MAESLTRLHKIVDQIDDDKLLRTIIRLLAAEKDPDEILILLEYAPSTAFADSAVSAPVAETAGSVAEQKKEPEPVSVNEQPAANDVAKPAEEKTETEEAEPEQTEHEAETPEIPSVPEAKSFAETKPQAEKETVPETVIPEPIVSEIKQPRLDPEDTKFHTINFPRFDQDSTARMTPDFNTFAIDLSSAESRAVPNFPDSMDTLQESEFQPLYNLMLDPTFAIGDSKLFTEIEKAVSLCQKSERKLNADNAEAIYTAMLNILELCRNSKKLKESKQILVENAADRTMKVVAPYIPNDRLSAIVK